MDEKERILKENFNEYFELAEQAYKTKKYNSAVTLFFKAIVSATDILILKKKVLFPPHTMIGLG